MAVPVTERSPKAVIHAPLHRRLRKLEAVRTEIAARADGIGPYGRLVLILVAHHIGAMTPEESVGVGLARALGYSCPSAFRSELGGETGAMEELEFDGRYAEAVRRLLALRGTTFADTGNGVALALKRLFYAMPEALQHHRFLDDQKPELVFTPIPDEPVNDPAERVVIEPNAKRSPHHAVAAHLYRASWCMPVEVPEVRTVQKAAEDYEQALRRL